MKQNPISPFFQFEYNSTAEGNSHVKRIASDVRLPKSLYKAKHIGYEYNDAGYRHKRSNGSTYLLAYTKSGKAYVEYEGERFCVTSGDLLFINLAKDSLVEAPNEPWEIYFVHVYGSDIADIYHTVVQTNGFHMPLVDARLFPECIMNIMQNAENNYDPYYVSAQIYLLLMDVLRQSNQNSSSTTINRAVAYLNRNFSENINVETLCQDLHVTKPFLIRKFRQELGCTPKQYLTQLRLEKAKSLLIYSDKSILTIAQESGFGTEKNIFYAFHSIMGLTPTEYRNNATMK